MGVRFFLTLCCLWVGFSSAARSSRSSSKDNRLSSVVDDSEALALDDDILKAIVDPRQTIGELMAAGTFLVFRPTSEAAIKLMTEGKAVGKGLDVKGKSSKGRENSGYVPFMQIDLSVDKQYATTMVERHAIAGEDGPTIDVYWKTVEARDAAKSKLDKVKQLTKDPFLRSADGKFGLRMPDYCVVKLFVKADLKVPEGHEMKRNSSPPSLEKNMESLKKDGQVVLLQLNQKDEMDPYGLMVSYAKAASATQGEFSATRVDPVASDFDPFLVGYNPLEMAAKAGLTKDKAATLLAKLPDDQKLVGLASLQTGIVALQSCGSKVFDECRPWQTVERTYAKDNFEAISKAYDQKFDNFEAVVTKCYANNCDNWMTAWMAASKKDANLMSAPMPDLGFGNETSIKNLKALIDGTADTGAVRHGAECFNYQYPQDLDSSFLLFDDPSNKPKGESKELAALTSYLKARANEGWIFPLNPIWVVRDKGWLGIWNTQVTKAKDIGVNFLELWYHKDIQTTIDEAKKKGLIPLSDPETK